MDNKETLQQSNTRINVNNEELASILITIDKLPTVKEVKLQDKVAEPSTTEQTITADEEYTGLASVTVNAVTNEIDSNIVAENIKNGVEILGVKGSFVGGKYAPRYLYESISFRNYTGTELEHETTTLDTTIFTNMSYMFGSCKNLTSLNLSGFNTSNVTNMFSMFYGCESLTSLDLSNFDTSNVTDMNSMFGSCTNLTSLDLSNFDTSNVTNMSYMFSDCSNLTHLVVSNFKTINSVDINRMFRNCNKLIYLDIRNFTFDGVKNYSSSFSGVPFGCEIIVKSDTERNFILTNCSKYYTNIKTVAELEG